MPENSPTVAAQLAQLPELPTTQLWALWDAHFPRRPKHINRAYIESRLAYRIQEKAYGGLSAKVRDRLANLGAQYSNIKMPKRRRGQELHLMPGTTLIREWDEREHRVTVTTDGRYELNGQLFKSLSAAARHITGTQWSGPKFFGVDKEART